MAMNKITKQTLRSWHVGADIYRWFLRHFPDGADYRDIHAALLRTGRVEWATSLVEYAYSLWLDDNQFIYQEIGATQCIIDELTAGDSQVLPSRLAATKSDNSVDKPPCTQPSITQLSSAADDSDIHSGNYCSKIATSGMNGRIASYGEYSWLSSAGYASQIASSGYAARVSSAGQNSRIGSSGLRSRIASAGNSTKISSSGAASRIANAGMRSRIGCVSERGRIANAGDLCRISAFADDSLIANAGGDTCIIAPGNNCVITSTCALTYVVLGKNGCAAIPYHDGTRIRFAIAYEGENGIQAGIKYTLSPDFRFVEYTEKQR